MKTFEMDLSEIFGPNTLCRERQFTSDPGNLDLPSPHVFLDDTSISDAQFVLPCSPEQTVFNDSELSADDDDLNIDIVNLSLPAQAAEQAEHLVRKVLEEAEQAEHLVRRVWEEAWKVCHFSSLPKWLQDNDFLHRGHRPPLPSFSACFRSIFRVHTETGNIWTHLLGCISFIGIAFYFLTRPSNQIQWQEKIVFATFFAGAIACLGMSFTFHTVHCHSEKVGKLFSKLDYCGIAFLIIGSFVPWLYYGFYCNFQPKLIYLVLVIVLGTAAIIVSLWDKFSEPRFRSVRAVIAYYICIFSTFNPFVTSVTYMLRINGPYSSFGFEAIKIQLFGNNNGSTTITKYCYKGVFMGFGLSGVVPAVHYLVAEGWFRAIYQASFGWLCLMGLLYIAGALFYALRVPERFFPGKCDIWFHSHQIFHILVIAAACVHYHGITEMAMYRLMMGDCAEKTPDLIS